MGPICPSIEQSPLHAQYSWQAASDCVLDTLLKAQTVPQTVLSSSAQRLGLWFSKLAIRSRPDRSEAVGGHTWQQLLQPARQAQPRPSAPQGWRT